MLHKRSVLRSSCCPPIPGATRLRQGQLWLRLASRGQGRPGRRGGSGRGAGGPGLQKGRGPRRLRRLRGHPHKVTRFQVSLVSRWPSRQP